MNKLSTNRILILVLFGLIIYRTYQARTHQNVIRGKNISNIELFSLDLKKTIYIKDVPIENKTLYIWATWCAPCIIQNKIIKVYKMFNLKTAENIIRISIDQNMVKLKKHLREEELSNQYHDPTGQFFSKSIIKGTPSFIKVNNDGEILSVSTGISLLF